jgi:hypothetical protein
VKMNLSDKPSSLGIIVALPVYPCRKGKNIVKSRRPESKREDRMMSDDRTIQRIYVSVRVDLQRKKTKELYKLR